MHFPGERDIIIEKVLGETGKTDRGKRIVKRMGKRGLLSLAAAGSMLGVIGCESVGGMDVNQAIVAMFDVKSSEGTMSLSWDVVAESTGDKDADRLMSVFGSGAVVVTEMLQEDDKTASMEGTIELSKGDIPFALYVDENTMLLDIEGAKKPFELDLAALGGVGELPVGGDALSDALSGEAGRKLVSELAKYALGHVPNPKDTKLGSTTETIDGASKTLTTISSTVDIEELLGLVKTAVAGIAEDEEGLKALIGTLYDALKPALEEMLEQDPDPMTKLILNNKSFVVDLVYAEIAPMLEELVVEMESAAELGGLLTPDSGATFELLLDGTKPAGVNVGFYLEPATDEADGFGSVRFDLESRWWNVNGDVKAKTYSGVTAPFPLDAKPRQRLDNVERDSLLYEILKKDLGLTRHSFELYMGENASVPDGVSPYIKGTGTTMVPVRYVSEQLDATVTWDGATSTITIEDAAEGIKIVMKIGSTTATVNGVAQTLPEAPEVIASTQSTFVPIGFITLALGGEKGWDPDWGIVTIEKEF